jgi:hypothetical protein
MFETDKILKLYTYVDGGTNDTLFPDADNPIEVGAFRYDAKRMGGAPTITASVNYPSCLDDEWTDNVYARFNGEKYYLKQTPTSSYNNESAMYKHDITLVSERVALDNVYFFDVVTGNPMDSDKPVSNSTKVVFFGGVREFARRMNASLEYSRLDYTIEVDKDVTSEEKLMSFEDQFFSNVLQEIYNTYEVPYYFDGKTIHIGIYKKNFVGGKEEIPTFAYGVDDALLSITKNNANYKIVNKATGTGSSDNIPFYYPNNSPKGNIEAVASNNFEVNVVNYDRYSNEVELNGIIRKSNIDYQNLVATHKGESIFSGKQFESSPMNGSYSCVFAYTFDAQDAGEMSLTFNPNPIGFRDFNAEVDTNAVIDSRWRCMLLRAGSNPERPHGSDILFIEGGFNKGEREVKIDVEEAGKGYIIAVDVQYVPKREYENTRGYVVYGPTYSLGSQSGWVDENGKAVDLASIGLWVDGRAEVGDTITQTLIEYVNTSKFLMPFKYRETDGKERFYNATNDTYEGVTFNNPFVEGKPKEHIIKVDDIKPSIEEMVNSMGLRMDMFSEFAYDLDDNDELVENEEGSEHEYVHSYFFAKLRKLDFNLFDHAIEQQPMTISFTSGDCGACNFEIGVTEEFPQKNPVQVNADGTLKRDEKGRVVCGQFEEITEDECQPQQQDTINNEVWIALKKEDSTYGILMPKAPTKDEQGKEVGGHRPKACSSGKNDGDTFVILGINLPYKYIEHAEKKLEAEIIKYLQENNDEKFTFSIGFSKVYFAENQSVLEHLSENSKIAVAYNGKTYELYVSSFSYSMGDNDILPEIRVELDETLKVSQNALQNAVSEVKSSLGSTINEVAQTVSMQKRSYVSKVEDDIAQGVVNFTKGIKFGEGGKVEVMDNNSAKLTIEYLEVTKKATFTSLEIQEKTHVGGQMLVTPASMNCGEVEELDDVYRCYFQTKGADGDEIFNQFAVGDQAICQTFNAWGSKYYWRLVTAIGEDYIDLSKTDCDEGSGVPSAGDKIIQMGNRNDEARQNAIVIAAYGEGSPYIIQYKGINNYDLPTIDGDDDRIMTMLSPTKNILTGQVKMVAGSKGLELFEEWAEKQELIDSKASGEDFDEFKNLVDRDIENIKKQVDGAITTWFYDPTPTLENAPAVDWTTDDDKNNHLGDLYYSGEGKAYRFQYDEATTAYYWNLIEDEDITEALGLAQQAKDTADGKRRVFVVQPTPPYDEGDLWSRGSTLPMMICVNTKASGSFAEGDWDFADNAGQLAEQIAGYEYIKEAIQNGSTIVTGGLIQSGVLMLGYNDADGNYHVMSGTNGVYDSSATGGGIAAWYGGAMEDKELDPNATNPAKSVIRHDGTGYLAGGNITWNEKGAGSVAGGALAWDENGSVLRGTTKIEGLTSLDNLVSNDTFNAFKNETSDTLAKYSKRITTTESKVGDMETALNNFLEGEWKELESFLATALSGKLDKTEFEGWKIELDGLYASKLALKDVSDRVAKFEDWFKLENGYIKATRGFFSDGTMGARAVGSTGGGGGGLIAYVYGYDAIEGVYYDTDKNNTFNAYTIAKLHSRIKGVEDAGYITSSALNGYAKTSDLADYATTSALTSGLATKQNEINASNRLPYSYLSGVPDLSVYLTSHQAIYGLTIKRNGTSLGVYTPNSASKEIDITIPTKLSDLTDDILSGKYLPLSGGTITFFGLYGLTLARTTDSSNLIHFIGGDNDFGYIGFGGVGRPIYADHNGYDYPLLHSGNYSDYALPLSGGTLTSGSTDLLTVDSTHATYSGIRINHKGADKGWLGYGANDGVYLWNSVAGKYLGVNNDGTPYYGTSSNKHTLLHSGNIGGYKAGDSALLDGLTKNEFYRRDMGPIPTGDIASLETGSYWVYENKGGTNPVPSTYSSLVAFGKSYYSPQMCVMHNASKAWLRGIYNTSEGNSASDWHELAFTDSTVAAANKLITDNTTAIPNTPFASAGGNNVVFGYDTAKVGFDTYLAGRTITLRVFDGETNNGGIFINNSSNVTIGGSDLAGTGYRFRVGGRTYLEAYNGNDTFVRIGASNAFGLHVETRGNGNTYFQSQRFDATTAYYNIVLQELGGNVLIGTSTDNGAKLQVAGSALFNRYNATGNSAGCAIVINKSNNFFGIGASQSDVSRISFGTALNTAGDWQSEFMTITDEGNVGIGTTDPQFKLDVEGSIRIKSLYGSLVFEQTAYLASYGNKRFLIHNENGLFLGYETTEQHTHLYGQTINLYSATTINSTLNVSGNAHFRGLITADSGIKIGDATITWDASANALKIDKSVYSIGGFGTK